MIFAFQLIKKNFKLILIFYFILLNNIINIIFNFNFLLFLKARESTLSFTEEEGERGAVGEEKKEI